ncbi:MAG: Calx-beta domain-containing protein [Lysobacterales bacterium]
MQPGSAGSGGFGQGGGGAWINPPNGGTAGAGGFGGGGGGAISTATRGLGGTFAGNGGGYNGNGLASGGGGAGLGGAIFNLNGTVTLENTTLTSNSAQGGSTDGDAAGNGHTPGTGAGAAIFNYDGSMTLRHVTVHANQLTRGFAPDTAIDGGAIANYNATGGGAPSLTLYNSVLNGTTDGTGSTPTFDLVNYAGGTVTAGGSANSNWIATSSGTITGTVRSGALTMGTIARTNGILLVYPAASLIDSGDGGNSLPTDARGSPRPAGGGVDVGAVEGAFSATATIQTGDLLVTEGSNDALYAISPSNGRRSLISKSGVRGSGPAITNPIDVAVDSNQNIYVLDSTFQGVIQIDRNTGDRNIVSIGPTDASTAGVTARGSGPEFSSPTSIAVVGAGQLAVTDSGSTAGVFSDAVFLIDVATGNRSVLSDDTVPNATNAMTTPTSIINHSTLGILVADSTTNDAVLRVANPGGARTIFSSSALTVPDAANPFTSPAGLAEDSDGSVLLIDTTSDQLLRLSASNGARTVVTNLVAADSYNGVEGTAAADYVNKTNTPDAVLRVTGASFTPLSSNLIGDGPIFGTAIGTVTLGLGIAIVPGPSSVAPTVSSPTSASVTESTAVLGGSVDSDGGAAISVRGIVLAPTATNNNPQLGGPGVVNLTTTGTTGVYTLNATGLSSNTQYSFKAYATNSSGTGYSNVATFTTLRSANLAITKTDGTTVEVPGTPVTYTIVASNAGPDATGATVTDTLPATLTACSYTCVGAGGGSCPTSGSGNISASVSLPASASVTFTLNCAIQPGASGSLSNTASIAAAAGTVDTVPGNNSATDVDALAPTGDLAVTKSNGTSSVVAGAATNYNITVSNAGPSSAVGVGVSDTFPAACSAVGWTCTGSGGGTCASLGSGNINQTVNLPPGGSVSFSASCTISSGAAGGSLSNTATIAPPPGFTDSNSANNAATDGPDIIGCPAALVTNGADAGAGSLRQIVADACAGSTITFLPAVTQVTLSSGEIVLNKNLTIQGSGQRIDSNNTSRLFRVDAGVSVAMSDLTLARGNGVSPVQSGQGSAVLSLGSLSMDRVTVRENGPSAVRIGGACSVNGSAEFLDLRNSLFTSNGDAALFVNCGVAIVRNSTFTGTAAAGNPAVAQNFGRTLLIHSTVAGNAGRGIGVSTYAYATVVANNAAGDLFSSGIYLSGGSNLYGTLTGSTIRGVTDGNVSNVAAGLAPLGSYGGSTDTLALLPGSVAINGVVNQPEVQLIVRDETDTASYTLTFNGQTTAPLTSPNEATLQSALEALPSIGAGNVDVIGTGSGFPIAVAVVQFTGALANTNQPLIVSSRPGVLVRPILDGGTLTATDQRGITRAQGAAADIGAYESRGFNRTLTGGSPQSAAINSAFASPLSLTVTAAASGEPVSNGSISYSAPGAGPSASLAPAIATLNAGGVASSVATANGTLGSYNVTADFRGNLDGPLSFALSNRAPAADLSVSKTNGSSSIVPGTGTSYTIVVANAGPDATSATLVDNLPPQLVSCSWTCAPSGGASCNASGSGSINETLAMPAASSASFTLNCSVPASATGSVLNTATVSGTTPDPVSGNNTAVDNDALTPRADVVVGKSDGRTTVEAGTSTSYTILVTNAGPSNAPVVNVIDVLPAVCSGVTWTCAGSSGGSCASSGAGNIAETLGLPAGASVLFAVNCTVAAAATGNLVNTAQAAPSGGVNDENLGNNVSTDSNTIIAQPQLGVVPVSGSFVEGTPAVFRMQLTAPALSAGVSGTVSTSDGTAQAPGDYTPLTTQPFTIPAGQSFVDVPVATINDSTVEGAETLTLTVVGALQGAQPGTLSAAATLTDNDQAQINLSAASYSASEGAAQISVQITTTAAVQSGVTVSINSTNGTAGAADYTPVVNGSVSFPPNSGAPQTLTIPINNDLLDEDDETFTLTLSGQSGSVGDVSIGPGNSALLTILDDDALPALSISSPSQLEGNSGQAPMNFVITLTPVSGRTVSFTRATVDGSATVASNDYVALAAQTLTIPAGQTSVTVPVQIIGDTVYEGDQSFTLNLSSVVNATPTSLSGTGTILEDDQQPTTTTISSDVPDPSVVGQPYLVSVNVSAQTISPVGSVLIGDGSATCTASLSAATSPNAIGSCSLTSTTAGAKTLTATYSPSSAVFAGSSGSTTHQVNAALTTLAVSGPARSRINQPTSFSFALAVSAPGAGTPTGTVTLSSGASSCTATLPTTSCALIFTSLGSRTVTASYAGDGNYAASTSSGAGNAQTLVYALSDVSISKTDAISIYQTGELLVYTVTVRNLGPDAAAQIRVRDDIPAGLLNTVWSCDAAGGVSCPVVGGVGNLDTVVGQFPVGGVLNFTFYGNAGSGQEISNTALLELPADTTIDDPATGNNSAIDLNKNDLIFRDGLEDPPINAPNGSFRVPGLALRSVLDEVAVRVLELRDARGLALRLYARQWDGSVQYALALRGSDGLLRLGAWQSLPGEPVLRWTALSQASGWVLDSATLQ